MVLTLNNLHVRYGSAVALKDISFSMEEGSIVTLLGANGAGKTTTVKAISGIVMAYSGSIEYLGEKINGLPAEKIARLGITLVPEGRQLFVDLTVKENLLMGAVGKRVKSNIAEDMGWVFSLFPRLQDRIKQFAGTLSGGEQQMLAIGRALMAKPRLLLLDEPSLGLAPFLVKEIFETLRTIHERNVSILLVEQNMTMALKLAQYAYILDLGTIGISGPAGELLQNDKIKKAYLSYDV
jgi:branched-chain amino acid transport system ATP-binding protein